MEEVGVEVGKMVKETAVETEPGAKVEVVRAVAKEVAVKEVDVGTCR